MPNKTAPASPRLRLLAMYRALGSTIKQAAELSGYGHVQSAATALSRPTGRAELQRLQTMIEEKYIQAAIIGDLQRAGFMPPTCSRCETCANYTPRTQDAPADPDA